MPSGKTHDFITLLLAPPTFLVALSLTNSFSLSMIVTAFMLFGGLMFGPDLDTLSLQYTRWGWFRAFWYPYRVIFRHRSRWSHGLAVGTLIRVLYFTGIIALLISLGVYVRAALIGDSGGSLPSAAQIVEAWITLREALQQRVGDHAIWASLIGLWWGAASHTLADVSHSMLRKAWQIF